jgi:hypothetical protein
VTAIDPYNPDDYPGGQYTEKDLADLRKLTNKGCAVLHQDAEGNVVPCPGHHTATESAPQPECITCHGGGAPSVQEAVQRIRDQASTDRRNGWTTTLADMADIETILTALEKHHE